MARVTSWRSLLGARWLGWTVLYALAMYGAEMLVLFIFPRWNSSVGLFLGLLLGLLAMAFLIGVRFQSLWWVMGPSVAFGLAFFVLLLFTSWTPPPPETGYEGWSWDIVAILVVGTSAVFPCSFAAFAVVWWGERRAATSVGSSRSNFDGDGSP